MLGVHGFSPRIGLARPSVGHGRIDAVVLSSLVAERRRNEAPDHVRQSGAPVGDEPQGRRGRSRRGEERAPRRRPDAAIRQHVRRPALDRFHRPTYRQTPETSTQHFVLRNERFSADAEIAGSVRFIKTVLNRCTHRQGDVRKSCRCSVNETPRPRTTTWYLGTRPHRSRNHLRGTGCGPRRIVNSGDGRRARSHRRHALRHLSMQRLWSPCRVRRRGCTGHGHEPVSIVAAPQQVRSAPGCPGSPARWRSARLSCWRRRADRRRRASAVGTAAEALGVTHRGSETRMLQEQL